eukprot:354097-Chlamydomonas_euryale.AAC.2
MGSAASVGRCKYGERSKCGACSKRGDAISALTTWRRAARVWDDCRSVGIISLRGPCDVSGACSKCGARTKSRAASSALFLRWCSLVGAEMHEVLGASSRAHAPPANLLGQSSSWAAVAVAVAVVVVVVLVGAQLFGTRLGSDPAEDLPIAGPGECFPGQAAET